MMKKLNESILIGGALTREDLVALRAEGVGVLVDLRETGEPPAGGLAPREVRAHATVMGMTYRQIPVSPRTLDLPTMDRVRSVLVEQPRPVMVHCASGRRAAALVHAHLGRTNGWSPDECLARIGALGFDLASAPALRNLVLRYLAREPVPSKPCCHGVGI